MPNDIPSDTYSLTLTDRSTEKSTTRIGVQSFADLPSYIAARAAFETEVIAATLGTLTTRSEALITRLANGGNGAGNRELKYLVTVNDNVTFENFTFTLPTADDTAFTFAQNSDEVQLSSAASLVTAIQGFYQSPRGNLATVTSIRLVGRNL